MIQIYYGYGKGKTTAAIGAGMRAMGAGMSVLFVQFFKDNKSSELSVLPFEIYQPPQSLPFNPGREDYKPWVDGAVNYVLNSNADMIILDEFIDLVPKFLSVEDALKVFDIKAELIVTGHSRIEKLFDRADYVTNMQKEKHPYDRGIFARRGIEY